MSPVPFEFVMFGLKLALVAFFHRFALHAAVGGLIASTVAKLLASARTSPLASTP